MNQNLKSLYKEILLKHSREPHNKYAMIDADAFRQIKNPLCGDIVTVYLSFSNDRIIETSFDAQCCSICMASASLLTGRIVDIGKYEGLNLARSLIELLSDHSNSIPESDELQALCGVKEFPSRMRCATLPWEALISALEAEAGSEGAF